MITTVHARAEITTVPVRRRLPDQNGVWKVRDSTVERLQPAHDYNQIMNGVDIADQLRNVYSVRQRTRRWPLAPFYWILDAAATNSFVIYKQLCHSQGIGKLMTHSEFLEQLAFQLTRYTPPAQRGAKRSLHTAFSASSTPRTPSDTEQVMSTLHRTRPESSLLFSTPSTPGSLTSLGRRSSVGSMDVLQEHKLSTAGPGRKRRCKACNDDGTRAETQWICRACDRGFHPNCFFKYHIGVDKLMAIES